MSGISHAVEKRTRTHSGPFRRWLCKHWTNIGNMCEIIHGKCTEYACIDTSLNVKPLTHWLSLFFPFSFSLNTIFFYPFCMHSHSAIQPFTAILYWMCFFRDASCFCTRPHSSLSIWCCVCMHIDRTLVYSMPWYFDVLPSTCIFLLHCFFFLFKYSVCVWVCVFLVLLDRKIGRTR